MVVGVAIVHDKAVVMVEASAPYLGKDRRGEGAYHLVHKTGDERVQTQVGGKHPVAVHRVWRAHGPSRGPSAGLKVRHRTAEGQRPLRVDHGQSIHVGSNWVEETPRGLASVTQDGRQGRIQRN